MKTHKLLRISGILFSLLLMLGAMTVQAQGRYRTSDFQRFSFSLGGGFGFSEGHRGMMDLASEFQFGLSSRVRFGLGVGYINSLRDRAWGMDGGAEDKSGRQGMDQGMSWLFGGNDQNNRNNGPKNDFRVIPVSLNVYYSLPVGRKWNVLASGGGSYYFGTFNGSDFRQHKNAWGGQASLGFEFRVAGQLRLVGQGGYRFVEFHHISLPQAQTQNPWQQLLLLWNSGRPKTDSQIDITAWQNFLNGLLGQGWNQTPSTQSTNVNLSGFVFHLGLKFGF